MGLLRGLFARFLTKPALDALAERLKTWLHTLVDIAVAYGLMMVYNWLNSTNNDVIMAEAGPSGFTGWISLLIALAGLLTRILPFVLSPPRGANLLVLFSLLGAPAFILAGTITGPTSSGVPHFTSDIPKTSTAVWIVTPRPDGLWQRWNDDGSFDFAAPPGVYTVILVEVTRTGEQLRTEQAITIAAGNVPTPPPGPPTPPNVPDGVHGFTKWAYATVSVYPPADRVKGREVATLLKTAASQVNSADPAATINLTVNGKTATYPANPKGLQSATTDLVPTFGGSWSSFPAGIGTKLRADGTGFTKSEPDFKASWVAFADGVSLAADLK
jgi:hypothetical protein